MLKHYAELFGKSYAGRRALDWTGGLARFHREPGMPGHRMALDFVMQEVEKLGLDVVEAREFQFDGRRTYYTTWASVPQWVPHAGLLEVVSPVERVLADFSEIPVVLGIRSAPTPPGGIVTELVDIGQGTLPSDYRGKDIRGKIILCDPNGQLGVVAMDMARRHGAAGVVICNLIDNPAYVTRDDRPDHIAHVWTTYWFLGTQHDFQKEIFSFSVSPRQLGYLRSLLAQGPVKVRAVVDAEFTGGTVRQISGLIRGTDREEEEVVYLGHVDHPWPGANDNASGCGAMMELAGMLSNLIRKGTLPRPRRSIRFLWGVHMIGGVMWAEEHPGWGQRVLGGFSPDGVGIGVLEGGFAQLTRTSDTRPSYVNDLVAFLARRLPVHELRSQQVRFELGPLLWGLKEVPWTGGVDACPLNDRDIGAHTVGMGHQFDRSYHTDRDTYARLDIQEFERVGWLLAMAGYLIANAGEREAKFISQVSALHGQERIAELTIDAIRALEDVESVKQGAVTAQKSLDRIEYGAKQAIATLESVRALDEKKLPVTLAALERSLMTSAEEARDTVIRWTTDRFEIDPTASREDEDKRLASVVPVRKFQGPFNFHDIRRILATRLGWERTDWLAELQSRLLYPSLSHSGIPGLFLAIDGKTSLLEISKAIEFEYGSSDPSILSRLLDDLAEAGLVDIASISKD